MKYPLLLLCIVILSPRFCTGQVNPKIAPLVNQFARQIRSDLEKDNLHGSMSVAIIKNDQVIWSSAFGFADSQKDVLADTVTIYRIGSITKTFTATLLMLLVEDDKLKLDDPVENYLPEIKNLKGYADIGIPITFRQLASHTAGLKREPDMSNGSTGDLNEWDQKLLQCIPKTGSVGKPGAQFLYSNMGFALLGLALQRAAGVPYMQMVQDRIFTPLHMTDTFFALPADKRSRLAQGMENSNGTTNLRIPLNELKGRGYRVPNGGIFTTPRDLSKFVMSLMGKPALLTAKSLRQMKSIPDGGKNYGLGLMILNNPKYDIFGHNGSVPGYTSEFTIDQGSGYAVILMRNYNKGVTDLGMITHNLLKDINQTN